MRKNPVMPDTPSMGQGEDGRWTAPAATRNQVPILDTIRDYVPVSGQALEIASGTGQHCAHFAETFPNVTWQPSDPDSDRRASIDAWRRHSEAPNLLPPINLDATSWVNGPTAQDLIFLANLFHLISIAEAKSVITNIAKALRPGGAVFIYGPFRDGDAFRSDGDRAFDASLRKQDADIGYKSDADLIGWAKIAGLTYLKTHQMPANNLAIAFRLLS